MYICTCIPPLAETKAPDPNITHKHHPSPPIQMSTQPKSRWDTTADDPADIARLQAEKESKKRLKAEKDRRKADAAAAAAASAASTSEPTTSSEHHPKRRKLDDDTSSIPSSTPPPPPGPLKLLRFEAPEIAPCRHVDNYELLNHIEEGSYGIVSRARDTSTGEIVALKKLKLEREKDGFPITSLREIQTLMTCKHPNVVNLREVVMGDALDQ